MPETNKIPEENRQRLRDSLLAHKEPPESTGSYFSVQDNDRALLTTKYYAQQAVLFQRCLNKMPLGSRFLRRIRFWSMCLSA